LLLCAAYEESSDEERSGEGGEELVRREDLGAPPVAVIFSSATNGEGERELREAIARGVALSTEAKSLED
jgi:hypothetical protein